MEKFIQKYCDLEQEVTQLQEEAEDLAQQLAVLETEKWQTEERRYIRLENGALKALTTLQSELLDTVGLSYEAEGKTKDERAANLLRHVRRNYPEYDEYEQKIQEVDHGLRVIRGKIDALTEASKVKQKGLMAIQAKIETVGKIVEALSRSQTTTTLAETERRLSDRIDRLALSITEQHGELTNQRAVIKEMAAAL